MKPSASEPPRRADRRTGGGNMAEARGAGDERPPRFRLTRLWPLLVLAAGLLALWLAGAQDYLSLSYLVREHAALAAAVSDNMVRAAALYVAVYVVAVAVSFPGASLITIIGGYLFGAVAGTLLTVVAATAGASIVFLAARTSVGEVLRARAGRFTQRLAEGFEENAFSYLFLLRLVPLFPFWLINVAPAMFNVSLATYVAATALGIVPGTIAYTLIGASFTSVIAEMEAANPGCAEAGTCELDASLLLTPEPLIAMAALVVVALIPLAVKRWRRGRAPA